MNLEQELSLKLAHEAEMKCSSVAPAPAEQVVARARVYLAFLTEGKRDTSQRFPVGAHGIATLTG